MMNKTTKGVLEFLRFVAHAKKPAGPNIRYSNRKLSITSGWSPRTLSRSFLELEKNGHIKRKCRHSLRKTKYGGQFFFSARTITLTEMVPPKEMIWHKRGYVRAKKKQLTFDEKFQIASKTKTFATYKDVMSEIGCSRSHAQRLLMAQRGRKYNKLPKVAKTATIVALATPTVVIDEEAQALAKLEAIRAKKAAAIQTPPAKEVDRAPENLHPHLDLPKLKYEDRMLKKKTITEQDIHDQASDICLDVLPRYGFGRNLPQKQLWNQQGREGQLRNEKLYRFCPVNWRRALGFFEQETWEAVLGYLRNMKAEEDLQNLKSAPTAAPPYVQAVAMDIESLIKAIEANPNKEWEKD